MKIQCPVCFSDLSYHTEWADDAWNICNRVSETTLEYNLDTDCHVCDTKLVLNKTEVITYSARVVCVESKHLKMKQEELAKELAEINKIVNHVNQYNLINKPI